MKQALNKNNKLIHIIESVKGDVYTCPICSEHLSRIITKGEKYYG